MLPRSFLIFSLSLLVGGNFIFHVKGIPNPNPNPNLGELSAPAPAAVDEKWIVSCSDMELSPSPLTKRETAYSHGNGKTSSSVEVVCDFETDGGGWTIIQRRTSGPKEEFNRNWTEYSNGFGSLSGNFWLGLENIRALTKNGDQELRIELEDFQGNKTWAKYSTFSISDASDFYRLKVGGFYKNSTAADIMTHFKYPNNGYRFIARGSGDQKCVDSRGGFGGGWWFGDSCGLSNLNGLYTQKEGSGEGIMWYDWTKGIRHAKSEMKIRNRKFLAVDPQSISSCSDALEVLPSSRSKKQPIYPHGNGNSRSLEVLCDFEADGGGWTLIQRRTSGPKEEFSRNWTEYAKGFGSLDGNFWLGLDNIYALTKNGDQELRIELEDFEGNKKWEKYSNFSISDASDFYRLKIGGFSGTAGDSMTTQWLTNNKQRFTTKDRDLDQWSAGNCARHYGGGGWWYPARCGSASLNGPYQPKEESGRGIMWNTWKAEKSLAKSEMKIRKKK